MSDVSKVLIQGVPEQKQDGRFHPVAHETQTPHNAEQNYGAHEWELLAVVYTIRK